jgi:dTDP-4-amino-4,6-dideoxygalactose transaminase
MSFSAVPEPGSRAGAPTEQVPFFRSELDRRSLLEAATDIDLDAPSILGPATWAVERELEQRFQASSALLTHSATAGLEVLARVLKDRGCTRAIVPSFAHVSCASAFHGHGYVVDFADVGSDHLLDAVAVDRLRPDRHTVVVAVHYGGASCDLDRLAALCRDAGSVLIEDMAHSFASAVDRPRSSVASAAVLSFHLTKELTCGEGGALLVTDPDLVDDSRLVRDRGTDRAAFEAGEVRHYTWVASGSAYAPSELTARVLQAQLRRSEPRLQRRRSVLRTYVASLEDWAANAGATLPTAAARRGAANLAFVRVNGEDARESLRQYLADGGIGSAVHFPPLHLSSMGRRLGGRPGQCPRAEAAFEGLLRLPLNSQLSDEHVATVVERVSSWRPTRGLQLAPSWK